MLQKQGPLRAYSTRSMERSIGFFAKRINSKSKGGQHASNLVERFAVQSSISMMVDIGAELQVIKSRQYSSASYIDHPNDNDGAQLWEPFNDVGLVEDVLVEGVDVAAVLSALKKCYTRATGSHVININRMDIKTSARLWRGSSIFSSAMYRRVKNEFSRGNHYIMFTSSHRT